MNDKEKDKKYYCTNCGMVIDRSDYCVYCGATAEKIVPYDEEK